MNRLFRYFYVSDLIAVVGASISYIAIYWTCAQLLSPAAVSLVIGAVFVIRFISSSLVGPWIDRIEPVRLLKATVLIRCFLLVAVWYHPDADGCPACAVAVFACRPDVPASHRRQYRV